MDITAHVLNPDDTISELYSANGGSLGGTNVDARFVKFLEETFGEEMITEFRHDNPSDWLQIMVSFEQKKRALDPGNKKQSVNVPLSFEFVNCYKSITKQDIKTLNHNGVKFGSGMLRIPYDVMDGLFEPVVSGIVSHIKELLQKPEMQQVSLALLVGGFGESAVLQKAIKEALGNDVVLLVPPDASLCVMKGAVLYGHSPDDIAERIIHKTYGISLSPVYDPSIHSDPNKIVIRDGIERAEPVFYKWATKGDKIRTREPIISKHSSVESSQKQMLFTVYQTDKTEPEYTDEEGIEKVAEVTIDLPGEGLDREVELSVTFGGTEIQVEAWDPRPGGDRQTCTIDFLQNWDQSECHYL